MYIIVSSVNRDTFVSFFLTYVSHLLFSCFIAQERTSSTMLSNSSEIRHLFLFTNPRVKEFNPSLLSIMLVVGLS